MVLVKLSFNVRQGNVPLAAFCAFGLAQFHQVVCICKPFLNCDKFLVREHDELLFAVSDQDFRVKFQHGPLLCSLVRIFAVQDTINDSTKSDSTSNNTR